MRAQIAHIVPWLPAAIVMVAIFVLSAIPAAELPQMGVLDVFLRKAGHTAGYGLLAVSFWYALGRRGDRRGMAWLLAVAYAATDELHQSFTPGRHAWWADVIIFDALGAYMGLWLTAQFRFGRGIPPSD